MQYQEQAKMLFAHAKLVSSFTWGNNKNKDLKPSDVFPYWTDKEQNEDKLQKYKNIMYRHANSKH